MVKITNRQGNIILFSSLFILLAIILIRQFWKGNDLKENGIIVNAKIDDILFPTKGTPTYEYEIFYKGKKYIDDNSTGIQTKTFFIGRSFPARFSPKTGNSELLMTPEKFENYGLEFPDSLEWVLKYKN